MPISHRCYLREVACEWELTKETIYLPLGCLQGGGPADAHLLEAEEVLPRRERHGVGEEKNDICTENVSSRGPSLALTG